jgi:hypothetical protein
MELGRAHFAAINTLSQQGQGYSVALFGKKRGCCFKCLEAEREENTYYLMDYESRLPSICVD